MLDNEQIIEGGDERAKSAQQQVLDRINAGELAGAEALDAWIDAGGEKTLSSDHVLMATVLSLNPALAVRMSTKLPLFTSAEVEIERYHNRKIMAILRHVIKEPTHALAGVVYYNMGSVVLGSFMCRDAQQIDAGR